MDFCLVRWLFNREYQMMNSASLKIVLALAAALSVSACSKKPSTSLDAGLNGAGGVGANAEAGLADGSQIAGNALPGSTEDFQQNVGDRVLFANDQSTLDAEGRDTLMKQAKWMKQYPDVIVQVEGHADERGTREYNISLSARRATAVRAFLISQGIKQSRLATIAYGKERPASVCDTEECWSQNRRSVTVITGGAKTS
jgi:peptidoglycan-associated lipoprotein